MAQIIKLNLDKEDYYISEQNAAIAEQLEGEERSRYIKRACISVGKLPEGVPVSRVSQGPVSTAETPEAAAASEVKKSK